MENIENQGDNFLKNSRVSQIRNHLLLEQQGFAEALGVHQSMISYIEKNKKKVSIKTQGLICRTFFINPLFFERGGDVAMFLDGKENDALEVAASFRRTKTNEMSKKVGGGHVSSSAELQAVVIEKLTSELELTKELLKSKEEMIILLKEQLERMGNNYENLSKEISDLGKLIRQDVIEKQKDTEGSNSFGETDNPNEISPVKSSG